MNHPDDGTLQSLVDGELSPAAASDARGHLEGCTRCAERLEALEHDRRLVSAVLAEPDLDMVRVRAARNAVMARRNARGSRARPWWRGSLARAAGLILALSGVASAAIPGSPVRVWLEQRLASPNTVEAPPETEAVERAAAEPESDPGPQEAGIQVGSPDGPLTVTITGLAPGASVDVVLVDGERSGVYAPSGARFSSTPGGLQADVDGGYVRVELARSLESAAVEVDGALYLRKSGDRLELPGPGRDSTEAHFRFQVPDAPGVPS